MADIRVGYFLEDIGQEAFLTKLVTRIAEETDLLDAVIEHDSRSAIGGRGTVTSELRRFLRDVQRGNECPFDVLVVAIDANCHGYNEQRNDIQHIVEQTGYLGTVVCAIPDPHIERWYLEDVQALRDVTAGDVEPDVPPYKCERGRYKRALREAFHEAGIYPPLGGAEYGPDIAEALDLYQVGKADTAFAHHESRQETFVAVPEQGGGGLITPGVLDPGITFTVGRDREDGRLAIFRVEVQAVKGSGKLRVMGASSRAARDAIQTAHTYLKTNASQLGLTKHPGDHDLHAQLVNPMGAKEGSEIGMAFFVAMVGALLGKPVQEALLVLGNMTLRGGLQPVGSLTERLQLAMDNGAKRVLLPLENKRDFVDIPGDVLDKLQIIFYSEPINAAFRAMGLA